MEDEIINIKHVKIKCKKTNCYFNGGRKCQKDKVVINNRKCDSYIYANDYCNTPAKPSKTWPDFKDIDPKKSYGLIAPSKSKYFFNYHKQEFQSLTSTIDIPLTIKYFDGDIHEDEGKYKIEIFNTKLELLTWFAGLVNLANSGFDPQVSVSRGNLYIEKSFVDTVIGDSK